MYTGKQEIVYVPNWLELGSLDYVNNKSRTDDKEISSVQRQQNRLNVEGPQWPVDQENREDYKGPSPYRKRSLKSIFKNDTEAGSV